MPKRDNDDFPKGTVVRLISGGPDMTVNDHNLVNGIQCVWFSGKKLESGWFAPEALMVVKDDGKAKD